MVEYYVYRLENGEPIHEVFSDLAAAKIRLYIIKGKKNVEWVEVSGEKAINLDEPKDVFPSDSCGV